MKQPIAVFDLDGTLVHTAPDLVSSINYAISKTGFLPAEYSELAPFAGTGGRGMLQSYCNTRNIAFTEPEIINIISNFLDDYEVNLPGQSIVYEGAIEFVLALKSAGFKTAICTNKPQKLADKLLTKLNIERHFDAICGADYFAFRKPDPRHLTETIALTGGNISRAIMFGDSQTDFDTANAAGIPVVGLTFGYSPEPVTKFKTHKIVSHYNEINVAAVETLIGR
jgi:phosphoglycolate phosphatase